MSERRAMKGRLVEMTEQEKQLAIRFRSNCERIGLLINPLLNEPGEMRIAEAATLMDDLVVQQAELLRLRSRIEAIKDELYG